MVKKRFALDANAIVSYIEDRAGAEKVGKLIAAAESDEAEIMVATITVGEAFYSLSKKYGHERTKNVITGLLSSPIEVVEASLTRALHAAEIKAIYHMGYADSFVAELALERKASVVTADPDFKKLGDKIKVLWLPSHKAIN